MGKKNKSNTTSEIQSDNAKKPAAQKENGENRKRKNDKLDDDKESVIESKANRNPDQKKKKKNKQSEGERIKTTDSSKSSASTSASASTSKSDSKGKGMDMFDELFATKKEIEQTQKKQEEDDEKRHEEYQKMIRNNNNNSSSVLGLAGKNAKSIELSQDRSDVNKINKGEWANDGLGGVFDADGFTGRKEGGSKIYKAHLFNKKGFGTTEDCPFDCKCCYI